MTPYLHGRIDFAKTLRLSFRVGDQDLPDKRILYTSSREEEKRLERGHRQSPFSWHAVAFHSMLWRLWGICHG